MDDRQRHLKFVTVILWMSLLACSGRISPNKPDDDSGSFHAVSSSPANNATNVPSGAPITISVTFSAAVDTSAVGFLMAPLPTTFDRIFTLSADGKTIMAGATLQSNTAYTAVIYSAKDKNGNALNTPFQTSFTTGSTFPGGRVQGVASVQIGGQTVSPKGTLVGLLKIDLLQVLSQILTGQDPLEVLRQNLAALTVVSEDNGNYAIANVAAGTYWPAAIKDVNGDASLNPLGGDALGYYENPGNANGQPGKEDSVRVAQGQTVTNINILLVGTTGSSPRSPY